MSCRRNTYVGSERHLTAPVGKLNHNLDREFASLAWVGHSAPIHTGCVGSSPEGTQASTIPYVILGSRGNLSSCRKALCV